MVAADCCAHAMSVDVEDWLNATVLQHTGRVFPPGPEVVRNSEALLELFARTGARATWFFLGEVAEKFPALVERVAAGGHELGVHGFHHHSVRSLSPAQYRESIRRAKKTVEDAGRGPATGHRAVDFGVSEATWWALDEVLEAGFLYDASVFPAWTPRYGMREAPLSAHWEKTVSGRSVFEIPTSVCPVAGLRVPFAGGGWFRTMPLPLNEFLARRTARIRPLVYYVHPCEIEEDPQLGPLPGDLSSDERRLVETSFRSASRGRASGLRKYRALLEGRRFLPIIEVFRVRERMVEGRERAND